MLLDTRQSRGNRSAFTLVELLVVIAIIAVLMSLAAWGVIRMIGTQQNNNTEATVRVLNKLLMDRWRAVVEDARKETPSPTALALAGNDPARAQVIWIKVRLMEAFPMSYDEINNPVILNKYIVPPLKFKGHFTKYQATAAGKASGGAGESSACLLMALKTLNSSGPTVDDQLRYAIGKTDGINQIDVLIDSFSRPLAFFRFPCNNMALQATNPAWQAALKNQEVRALRFADTTDPDGTLNNPNWYVQNLPLRNAFENDFHTIQMAGLSQAAYIVPVIVSAGKDGKFGLTPNPINPNQLFKDMSFNPPLPPAIATPTPPNALLLPTGHDAYDNIFSFKLRLD